MTADGEPLGYDEIIAMRDRLCNRCGWGGQVIRYGERYIPMPKMEDMCVYRGETYNRENIHSGVYRADDAIRECIREAKMNEFI